jgi:hypothetical protein
MFIPLAAVLGSFMIWKDQLPREIASHWSGTGPADGVMTVPQFLTVALVMTGGPALAAVVVALWPGMRAATRRVGLLTAGIVAGLGAQSWLVSTLLTMRVGDPHEVVLGAWSVLGFAAAAYGFIPFLIAPKPQQISHDVARRIDLGPGQRGAWSRTITAKLFLWSCLALIAAGIAIYATSAANDELSEAIFGLAVVAVVILVLASFSRYRVTADWRGLRVVSSLFRIPLKRIPLEDIETVEATEIAPSEWGGWGYRITSGRSALILRKGPGLIVTMTSKKQFALTLDDPDVPAALLATLRDRRSQAQASTQGTNG